MKKISLILFIFLNFISAELYCAVPLKINYQGKIEDDGTPVTGSKTFEFRIYDASSGGNLLWTSSSQNLDIVDGMFSTVLSAGTPNAISTATFSGPRYLEIRINLEILTPREEIVSTPYALMAGGLSSDAIIVVTANNVSSGLLAQTVIASSIAVNSIYTNSIQNNAITITKLANSCSDGQVLKISGSAWACGTDTAGVGGAMITKEGLTTITDPTSAMSFDGNQFNVWDDPIGEANISLNSSSATLQGNIFNVANKLIQLDETGNLPILNGSALTHLTGANISGNITGNAATATEATSLTGGANGAIPYQSAANTTQMLTAGAEGLFLQSHGPAAPTWETVIGSDNLGDHTATEALDMAGFEINNVSTVTFLSDVYISSASELQGRGIYVSTNMYVVARLPH